MTKRNRSRSGANTPCPVCLRKLRGKKGLKAHLDADENRKCREALLKVEKGGAA